MNNPGSIIMNDMLKNMLVWIVIAVVIMSVFNNFVPKKKAQQIFHIQNL